MTNESDLRQIGGLAILMVMAMAAYPAWLVPALVSVAVLLLGWLARIYLQNRKANEDAHKDIRSRIDSAKKDVKDDVQAVRADVQDLASKVDRVLEISTETLGCLHGFQDGQSSGGSREDI